MKTNIAEAVVAAFGGLTKTARACGAPITTVDSWRKSGRIPPWRRSVVLAAAREANVSLPHEFIEQDQESSQGAHQ